MWVSLIILQLCLIGVARSWFGCYGKYFTCGSGECRYIRSVCDGHFDCPDRSDEEVCDRKFVINYRCNNNYGKYPAMYGCDGTVDCSDGSDESRCWYSSCPTRPRYERCFHGACTTDRDSCCATSKGLCAQPQPNVSTLVMKTTLVYANGRDLYSLNLADNTNRRLHRQEEKVDITALTHSVRENVIFWIAGKSIWNTKLTAEEGEGRLYGRIETLPSVITMAYDWITANFYLAFKDATLVVCHRRAGTTSMLCSAPIRVSVKQVDWLALYPNTGRMYMASFTERGLEIAAAECNGGNSRPVFESRGELPSKLQLSGDTTDIYILKTYGEGSLSAVSTLNGIERYITNNITWYGTVSLALFNDVAILRLNREIEALMFWRSKTIVTRKKLNIPLTSRLFTLIDRSAQPTGLNRCLSRQCDQLCLLVPYGAVCACDVEHKLMEDGKTCRSRKEESTTNDNKITLNQTVTVVPPVPLNQTISNERITENRTMSTENSQEEIKLNGTSGGTFSEELLGILDRKFSVPIIMGTGAILSTAGCLVIIGSCFFVRKRIKARTTASKARAFVNFDSDTSPVTLEWS